MISLCFALILSVSLKSFQKFSECLKLSETAVYRESNSITIIKSVICLDDRYKAIYSVVSPFPIVILLKDTSLITTIGGKELLYAAQGIMNRTYDAMFPLLGVALIYLILVMLFTWLLSKFERRLAQSDR